MTDDTTWRRVKQPWEAFAKSKSAVNRRDKHTTSPDKRTPSELSIGPRLVPPLSYLNVVLTLLESQESPVSKSSRT
ncbi:hypothetical protein BJX68DRAFT_236972 [Aspergillus pseudodeflectus]|uniref:Uncharacterized protein n=1 Tax=Aspergillus pseudodeflectus TaxID=176178 RepID=A0ABR4KDW0_9EURO